MASPSSSEEVARDHEKGLKMDHSDSDERGMKDSGFVAHDVETGETNPLARSLKSRHMQMIAIGTVYPSCSLFESFTLILAGGSIGAGLFIGSGV